MKNIAILITVLAVSMIKANAAELDLSTLTGGAALGTGVTVKQLPSIISSKKVYCAKIQGKNYLASIGAMAIFRKTVTSRTRSVTCSDKVKRQAISEGIEVIQLSKSKLTPSAYNKLAKAMTRAFGV